MIASTRPITIVQGASFSRSFRLVGPDKKPLDLTGWTGVAQMRSSTSSATAYTFTVEFNEDRTDGIVKLSMTAEQTSAILVNASTSSERRFTIYLYDFNLTKPDGTVFRLLEGPASVSPTVIQS